MFTLIKIEGFRNKNFLVNADFTISEIIAEIMSLDSINDILNECEIFNVLREKHFIRNSEGNLVSEFEGDYGNLTITIVCKSEENVIEL